MQNSIILLKGLQNRSLSITISPPYCRSKGQSSVRHLYTFLFYLALPFIYLRLLIRSRKVPGYRERLGERVGFYSYQLKECIWIHAVSMGETIAAIPFIKSLQAKYPSQTILVTNMTPTGAARVKATFGDSVKQAYLPYDLPGAMERFIKYMHPKIAIIMETELWPNLIHACYQHGIPVCVVNARLSEKSAHGYQRVHSLTREMLEKINLIATHGTPDAKRFIDLGASADKVVVTGNIKFDLEIPSELDAKSNALRAKLGNRFIWIAASTHEGEEAIILNVHKKIREQCSDALLILVPRHPDRFDEIASLSAQQFKTVRRSKNETCDTSTAVYLGDTMGELLLMYSVADVAFVGGSLIPRGGHNLLEPGALRKPIIVGQHLFNFKEISELFFASGGAVKVLNEDEFTSQLQTLIANSNKREEMGKKALNVVVANRGALAKQLELVDKYLNH